MRYAAWFLAAALALAAPLTLVSSAEAQTPSLDEVPINENTVIFCRDSTGTPVAQTYANLGVVMRRYAQRFQFNMNILPGSPLQVVFSDPAHTPYNITYSVQPWRDDAGRVGILLLKMHLFLDGTDRDVDGSGMCYFTEYGR